MIIDSYQRLKDPFIIHLKKQLGIAAMLLWPLVVLALYIAKNSTDDATTYVTLQIPLIAG